MRWDHLFDDLESQLEREITAEENDLGVEEERLRLGRLSIRDRLLALHDSGGPLTLTLVSGDRVTVQPDAFGRDWIVGTVLDGAIRPRHCLLPLPAIASISMVPSAVSRSLEGETDARAEASLSMRLGLPFVLRDLCRRRRAVDLVLGAATLHGTIDRVGRDHLDLAVHEADAPRRASQVAEVRIVALTSVVLVTY